MFEFVALFSTIVRKGLSIRMVSRIKSIEILEISRKYLAISELDLKRICDRASRE